MLDSYRLDEGKLHIRFHFGHGKRLFFPLLEFNLWLWRLHANGTENATLALKRFQPVLKVVPNTAAEHGTVAEATRQTQPGRRQVLRFDGAERDSRGRLNAPFDNTSGRTRGPAPPCLADAVTVVAGPVRTHWRSGDGHGFGGRAGKLQHMHHPNVEYVPPNWQAGVL